MGHINGNTKSAYLVSSSAINSCFTGILWIIDTCGVSDCTNTCTCIAIALDELQTWLSGAFYYPQEANSAIINYPIRQEIISVCIIYRVLLSSCGVYLALGTHLFLERVTNYSHQSFCQVAYMEQSYFTKTWSMHLSVSSQLYM